MKSKAQEVVDQIKKHYPEDHCFNYFDLTEHLKHNRIDNCTNSVQTHSGYSGALGECADIYYNDGSMLSTDFKLVAYTLNK